MRPIRLLFLATGFIAKAVFSFDSRQRSNRTTQHCAASAIAEGRDEEVVEESAEVAGQKIRSAIVKVFFGLFFSGHAFAAITEIEVTYPIEFKDATGQPIKHLATGILWRDDSMPTPSPLLIFAHGRTAGGGTAQWILNTAARKNAEWFASLGYAVLAPVRYGYGKTGGSDIEAGTCWGVPYKVGFDAAALQMKQAVEWAVKQPYLDTTRVVYVGQSLGGATGIAMAALSIPNIAAVINFAGGAGGNPQRSPREPCKKEELSQIFSDYGKTAKTPMLWIYTENDLYWGAELPRIWFDGFVANGGKATFKQFSPQGFDGHTLYRNKPEVWRPLVTEYLKDLGLPSTVLTGK